MFLSSFASSSFSSNVIYYYENEMYITYKITTYNSLLCKPNEKGETLIYQRFSPFQYVTLYTNFMHAFNDMFSFIFINTGFVSLFNNLLV